MGPSQSGKPGEEEAESGCRHPGLERPTGPPVGPSELVKDLPDSRDGGRRTEPKGTQKCSKGCDKEWEGREEFAKEGGGGGAGGRAQTDLGGQHSELMPVEGVAPDPQALGGGLIGSQMPLYGFM